MRMTVESANAYINAFFQSGNQENIAPKKSAERSAETENISFVFDWQELQELCTQAGANAIRIYKGVEPETGEPTLLVVPCNQEKESDGLKNLLQADNPVKQHPRKVRTGITGDFDLTMDNI